VQAGLVTDSRPEGLIFALEPEVASVYCKQLPSDGFIAEGQSQATLQQQPGSQYMVVDCGGNTVKKMFFPIAHLGERGVRCANKLISFSYVVLKIREN